MAATTMKLRGVPLPRQIYQLTIFTDSKILWDPKDVIAAEFDTVFDVNIDYGVVSSLCGIVKPASVCEMFH